MRQPELGSASPSPTVCSDTSDAAGVAYIEARPEGGEGVSYVLDPIEMSRVWGDEARARELLAALNSFGVPRSS